MLYIGVADHWMLLASDAGGGAIARSIGHLTAINLVEYGVVDVFP